MHPVKPNVMPSRMWQQDSGMREDFSTFNGFVGMNYYKCASAWNMRKESMFPEKT